MVLFYARLGGNYGVHTFLTGISLNMKVVAYIELAYFESNVLHISHNTLANEENDKRWSIFRIHNNIGFEIIFHHYHHHVPPARISLISPLSLLLPIVHRVWQVFRATSRILT